MTDHAATPIARTNGAAAARTASLAPIGLVALQIVVWTALALAFEGSIDADVAEGVVDGPEWRLSYLRHPPLSSWLSGVAAMSGPLRYVVLFAIALAFGCGAFALVSLFVRRLDGRGAALVALLAGLGSPYATYWPLKFNHNIGVMPFWALVLMTAWGAFEGGSLASWALFGAAVGFGLWAKYAILHLVAPLGVAFLLVPEWRKRLAGPGPWLAAAIAVAIIAPQAIDVAREGATTLKWATHTTPSGAGERLGWMALFVLDAALANLPMALIAWFACGGARLRAAIGAMVAPTDDDPARPLPACRGGRPGAADHRLRAVRRARLLSLADAADGRFRRLVGPRRGAGRARTSAATRLDRASRPGRRSSSSATPASARRGGCRRRSAPAPMRRWTARRWPSSPSFIGPSTGKGPIPYIVSYGKVGFQAAGSIVFDLPYRVRALDGGEPRNAPWIDLGDLRRRGALAVFGAPNPSATVDGAPVALSDLTAFARPTLPGVKAPPQIYFAVIAPTP